MDMVNALIHTSLPVPFYGAITNIPETGTGPPHTLDNLTHIDCYMYDVIVSVQGGTEQQRQVFYSSIQALRWLFPSLPVKNEGLGDHEESLGGRGKL